MTVFESNLILTKDIVFDESITVKGDIICKNGLWNIKANDINANNIICKTRIAKNENSKTICKIFIDNKSKLPHKEQILKEEKF